MSYKDEVTMTLEMEVVSFHYALTRFIPVVDSFRPTKATSEVVRCPFVTLN
jgi:hypothetical protein